MSDSLDTDTFFRLTLDLLFIADAEGRFLRINPAFVEMSGYAEDDLLGRRLTDFLPAEDLQATIDALDEVTDGEALRGFETRFECHDGSLRWLAWRAIWDPDNEAIYGSAREITDQKEVERLKDEFVSVVSHELRTPLTSIRGALGLVVNSEDHPLSEQTAYLLEVADKNSQRLQMLVDDILDIEKIESGDIEFRPTSVDPGELLEEVAYSHASFAEGYDVTLETTARHGDRRIWVDRDRLFQVITNFVSNAIKYSPRGETVTLASQPVHEGADLRLSVSDNGEGIPEEFRDSLFDRFTQADASTTRQQQGTGLGLSIAKALTEQMGGTIDFMTEIGKGTTFFVDFPVHDPDQEPA